MLNTDIGRAVAEAIAGKTDIKARSLAAVDAVSGVVGIKAAMISPLLKGQIMLTSSTDLIDYLTEVKTVVDAIIGAEHA